MDTSYIMILLGNMRNSKWEGSVRRCSAPKSRPSVGASSWDDSWKLRREFKHTIRKWTSVGCGSWLSSWFRGPCFQPCLYPMNYLHPRSMYTLPREGVQRGGTPFAGSGEPIPLAGGSGGKRAPEAKNFLVKVYCNFLVNLDGSL